MESSPKKLELSEEQALYFRARRGRLAGPGAPDAATCARDLLGAQSQQEAPSLLALSQRIEGRPTAAALQEQLFAEGRRLVRTWGQRDTIHVYPADETWPLVVAARERWAPQGRSGPQPDTRGERKALSVARRKKILLREDWAGCVREEYLAALDPRIGDRQARLKFACGRLAWRLSLAGHLCHGRRQGARQTYASREHWHPELNWPRKLPDPLGACVELTRRYLAVGAPATVQDVAHFFGARVAEARRWLARLDENGETIPLNCGGRDGLLALARDEEVLREKPPRSPSRWPVRLLPRFDTLLMNHADKSWTVPEPALRPQVWGKAAMVAAVILRRGRVAGVWNMKKRGRRLDLIFTPLAGHSRRQLEKAVSAEARAVAAHLELEAGDLRWS